MGTTPPKLASRLLEKFLREELFEEVAGDLEEKFYSELTHRSVLRAKLNHWYQVINYLRPFAIRKLKTTHLTNSAMFRNYFKISYRNLLRHKGYSLINIGGLAVGMAVVILIGLWIHDEVTFNTYHHNYPSISRVIQNVSNNGEIDTWFNIPYPLADELRQNYGSDFKEVVLGTGTWDHLLSTEKTKITRTGAFYEPKMPELLTLEMISGSRTSLNDPSSVLLSESVANTLFDSADPIGQIITIDEKMPVSVAGVYRDIPHNSSFNDLMFVASWDLFAAKGDWIKYMDDPWRPNAFNIYVQTDIQADIPLISHKIKDAKLRKVNSDLAKKKPELFLLPMSQWHLFSDYKNGVNIGGRIKYVWLFGGIGVFVILLACINFMNLSTARSERRAREVGIRKAIGSRRDQLIQQFYIEAFMLSCIAFFVSLMLVYVALPFFDDVAEKHMTMPWNSVYFWSVGFGCCVVTGLIAGSYPALYLSAIRTVSVLKGTFRSGGQSVIFRKALVIVQFTVSVVLIIGTLVVFRQIEYAKDRPVGYDTNRLIVVNVMTGDIHTHFDAVQTELIQTGMIEAVAESGSSPTNVWSSSSGFVWEGKDPELSIDFPFMPVSPEFGKTVNWTIVKGRDFSRDLATDNQALIINESAASYMGLRDPIGQTITWFGTPMKVIGVVQDMIMYSPYQPVKPTIFCHVEESGNVVVARIKDNAQIPEALSAMQVIFEKFNPSQPFEYEFADDQYDQKFRDEQRIGKLGSSFAFLAIFISALGIFGMSSFVAERRTHEIGIRKVLGASVVSLWQMISTEFVILVAVSCLFAVPIAYYYLEGWLAGYEYRTSLSWWIFALAGLCALLITVVTVSFHALRAARMNPVKSLRSE